MFYPNNNNVYQFIISIGNIENVFLSIKKSKNYINIDFTFPSAREL